MVLELVIVSVLVFALLTLFCWVVSIRVLLWEDITFLLSKKKRQRRKAAMEAYKRNAQRMRM